MVTGAAVPAVPASDVREAAGCACLQLRRATRRMTRHFDAHLAPSGLTIGQFGFLAGLHRAQLVTSGLSLTALAGFADMDPTTLNRSLRPLIEAGLVQSGRDPRDRRVRLVFLTPGGRARLAQALPLWRRADAAMKEQVGPETIVALNHALEAAHAGLTSAAPAGAGASGSR